MAPGGQHGDPDVVVLHHRLAQLQQRRVIGQVEVKVWVLDVVERVLQRKKNPKTKQLIKIQTEDILLLKGAKVYAR